MSRLLSRDKKSLTRACATISVLLCVLCVIASPAADKNKASGRLLFGKVLDAHDNPVPDAVVYLTNSRTRVVKTYIVGQDGSFRFPALSAAVDYEVYAQYKGHKSDTKSVSQFDDRTQVYMDLRVATQ